MAISKEEVSRPPENYGYSQSEWDSLSLAEKENILEILSHPDDEGKFEDGFWFP